MNPGSGAVGRKPGSVGKPIAALVEATRAGEKKRIWSIEADLRSLKIDIHHFTRVVADWAPKALPDGRKDHL